jgi:hypothetical protein
MKLKKVLPTQELVFTNTDEFAVNLLISIMKNLGVPVYVESQEYDPEYPHLVWDGRCITQSVEISKWREPVNTIEDFVRQFTEISSKTIQLTGDYSAYITADKVVVGCQEITFEKLEEVWNTMLEIRNV